MNLHLLNDVYSMDMRMVFLLYAFVRVCLYRSLVPLKDDGKERTYYAVSSSQKYDCKSDIYIFSHPCELSHDFSAALSYRRFVRNANIRMRDLRELTSKQQKI